jgi:hypothetical protein
MTDNRYQEETPAGSGPDKPTYLVWRYRRWRAAHHQWQTWLDYLRWPSPRNRHALDRADRLVRQLEDNRP